MQRGLGVSRNVGKYKKFQEILGFPGTKKLLYKMEGYVTGLSSIFS